LNDINEDYIHANLQVNSFTTLSVNLMIFIDLKGNCVYERFVDLDAEKTMAMPDGLISKIIPIAAALKSSDLNGRTGIVMAGATPIMLAARPVLKNDMSGPSRGTLIVGRYLD
jgi:sensor domain CHASE-containing protein